MGALQDVDKASTIIATVSSTLKSLGIYQDVCSDPKKLPDEVTKLFDEQLKLLEEKLDSTLAQFSFEKIAAVIAAVLAAKIGGLVSEIYDEVVNEFLFGEVVGSIMSLASGLLAVIPGMLMFLQYQATRQLAKQLELRITLTSILNSNLNSIVTVLLQYMALFSYYNKEDKNSDVAKALAYINKAIIILTMETQRDIHYVVDPAKLNEVERLIDKAINILSADEAGVNAANIASIHIKYNLKTQTPSLATLQPQNWITYFKELGEELITHMEGESSRQILYDLFPVIPQFARLMLVQNQISSKLQQLNDKLPTALSNNIFNSKYLQTLDESVTVLYSKILTGKTTTYEEIAKTVPQPEFFTNPKTKTLTISSIGNMVSLAEVVILTIPAFWSAIEAAGEGYSVLAKITLADLKDVKEDIETKVQKSTVDMWDKLKWVSSLTFSKGYLKPATSKYAGITTIAAGKVTSLNSLEIAKLLEVSQKIFEELQATIKLNLVDESGKRIQSAADQAKDLGELVLPELALGSYLFSATGEGKVIIAKLKSMNLLFAKQMNQDRLEYDKAKEYISILENSKTFKMIEQLVQESIGPLADIPIMNEAIDKVLNTGDVSSFVNIAGNTTSLISDLSACMNIDTDKILGSVINFLSPPDVFTKTAEAIQAEIAELQQTAANTKAMMEDTLTKVTETMNALASDAAQLPEDLALAAAMTNEEYMKLYTNSGLA